ncbi:C1q-like domain-containing protein [Paenibacillus harenae]|uniref:C1q domain-containing protein n=1 Tax=Paenibacillus harenae TaxID=306543 RepID=A0ABT9U979_PAEHA|nr:hypothetical protein [Paenibacillus harenae]MDQ0116195.1 hypothetical protein [Paenibacillus harenae]
MVVKRIGVQKSGTAKGVRKPCKKVFKSAFRAIANRNQPVGTIVSPIVLFGIEKFDLGNEFNPVTSTFIPKQSGTYRFFSSVVFTKTTTETFDIFLQITVNGIVSSIIGEISVSSETVIVTASGSLNLRSGDKVNVSLASNGVGIIKKGFRTRFAGKRIR